MVRLLLHFNKQMGVPAQCSGSMEESEMSNFANSELGDTQEQVG